MVQCRCCCVCQKETVDGQVVHYVKRQRLGAVNARCVKGSALGGMLRLERRHLAKAAMGTESARGNTELSLAGNVGEGPHGHRYGGEVRPLSIDGEDRVGCQEEVFVGDNVCNLNLAVLGMIVFLVISAGLAENCSSGIAINKARGFGWSSFTGNRKCV